MVVLSCSSNQRISKIGDRTYRIECEDPLAKCLAQVERPCSQGFKILEGSDERRTYGVPMGDIVNEKRTSKAIVKCRSDALLGGDDDHDDDRGEATEGPRLRREPASTADRPAPVCVPGTTQACIGVGGCAGGQSCMLDGTAFSPCECAPATSPEPVATTTPSATGTASPGPSPALPSSALPSTAVSPTALPPTATVPALPPPSPSAVPTVPAKPSP